MAVRCFSSDSWVVRSDLGDEVVRVVALGRLGITAQELGVRPRDVEGEGDDLVCGLTIGIQDQEIARLGRVLLLRAEGTVPVDRLIQDLDDLITGQYRDAGRFGRLRAARVRRRCHIFEAVAAGARVALGAGVAA